MKPALCTALLLACSYPSLLSQTRTEPVPQTPLTTQTQSVPQTEPRKLWIAFSCECEDQTGSLFGLAFRDLLATSPRYGEAFQAEEKSADGKTTTAIH